MNRNELQRLASEWTRMAKNDIRNKVINFMEEVDATPKELAYVLAISEGELQQIIEGNGEITLSTFAKLLIATGNALEIKPIEDTPIGCYNNIPTEEELNHPLPRHNVFTNPRIGRRMPPPPHFGMPSFSQKKDEDFFRNLDLGHPTFMNDKEDDDIEEEMAERNGRPVHRPEQPRDAHGRFAPCSHAHCSHNHVASPFEEMTTDELVNIIKERLWDSEINLNRASKAELVAFLEAKDKRMNAYKQMKAIENDPKVNEFKKRMKKTLSENPHLRDWAKKFLGGLDN